MNVPSITVPWSQMTAGDMMNWPTDVEFRTVQKITIKELKRLHKLAEEDQLDFSPEFINRLRIKSDWSLKRDEVRSDITKYLTDKLAKKLNVASMQVPWSEMKAEDIINWPSDVEFRTVWMMSLDELKRLHKLIKEDQLDFRTNFLGSKNLI
jgi:hypothetical protein